MPYKAGRASLLKVDYFHDFQMFVGEEYKYSFTLQDTTTGEIYNRQAAYIKVVDYYNPGKE